MIKINIALVGLAIITAGWVVYDKHHQLAAKPAIDQTSAAAVAKTAAQAALNSHCESNVLGQAIIVSISQQHMWACDGSKTVYDNPVITGRLANDDSTPLGSYKIYAK